MKTKNGGLDYFVTAEAMRAQTGTLRRGRKTTEGGAREGLPCAGISCNGEVEQRNRRRVSASG